MNVYIPYIPNYKATQGPCPDGFHIPTADEREALVYAGIGIDARYDVNTGGADFSAKMNMPRAGYRSGSNGSQSGGGTQGRYWSSAPYSTDFAYSFSSSSTTINPKSTGNSRCVAMNIRPFRNEPISPLDGEIIKDGRTRIYGSEFTGNMIARNSSLGLISLSYNEGRKCITIADKNLGATTVWNSEDTLTQANCGNFYQWGNNYGFPYSGTVTTSSTKVDASTYGPGNYYSSSIFLYIGASPYDWSSVQNDNLRGYEDLNKFPELLEAYIGEAKKYDWLLVGGGGAGGRSRYRAGGGGGAGGLIYCEGDKELSGSYCIVIGAGGTGCNTQYIASCQSGYDSCFGDIVAYGGGGGGGMCNCAVGCVGANGGSGGGGSACTSTCSCGCEDQGNGGGLACLTRGGGGGGAGGAGCDAACGGNYYGGAGGCGCTLDISGTSVVYAGGGGGGGCTGRSAAQGGGCGGCYRVAGCPATTYGSGGGGGGCSGSCSCCMAGGNGCQGVFYISYPCSSSYSVTGGQCCYVCNGRCIHRFTSSGTLTIN